MGGRKWLARSGILMTSSALALALTEAGARLFLPAPQLVKVEVSENLAGRLQGENRRVEELEFVYGPGAGLYVETTTGRRLRANTVARIHGHRLNGRDIEIRTNSLGFRGPEVGPKERTRVLFLGDSITFGDYVDEHETFVRRVETLAAGTDLPLETINAGVGAIGLENELAILVETGLQTRPDVVVLGFYLNDVQNSQGVKVYRLPTLLAWSRVAQIVADRTPRWLEEVDDEASLGSRERWLRAVAASFPTDEPEGSAADVAFNRRILKTFDDWGSAWSVDAWNVMEPSLVELKRLSIEHDFQLLWLCFPVRAQVKNETLRDFPQRRLAEIARRLEVPLLDLLPWLRDADGKAKSRLFLDQCHHTAHGNALLADWIHAFLRENIVR